MVQRWLNKQITAEDPLWLLGDTLRKSKATFEQIPSSRAHIAAVMV